MLSLVLTLPNIAYAMPTSRHDAVKNYVLDMYDKDDGIFYLDPDTKTTNIEVVYSSVLVLYLFDTLEDINTTKVALWINSTLNLEDINDTNNYGGFASSPGGAPDIYSTYYAIQTLFYLDELDMVKNTTLVAEWINRTKNADGGYGYYPGKPSTLISTYYAIECLILLNEPSYINYTELKNLVLDLQVSDKSSIDYGAFKGSFNESAASIESTYAAVNILYLLNAVDELNYTSINNWVMQKWANGGFRPSKAHYPDIFSTYWCISTLNITTNASISSILDIENVTRWVLSLQKEDGGFSVYSIDETSSPIATALAIETLYLLGSMGELDNQVPWEKGGLTYLYLFLILIFGSIAVVVLAMYVKSKIKRY